MKTHVMNLHKKFRVVYDELIMYVRSTYNKQVDGLFLYSSKCRINNGVIPFTVGMCLRNGSNVLLRGVSIEVTPAIFVTDISDDYEYIGLYECDNTKEVLDKINGGGPLTISIDPRYNGSIPYFSFDIQEDDYISDELGELFDINSVLSPLKYQEGEYVGKEFSLVGTYFNCSKTSLENINCILLAETDNKYDVNAIKVLRWFPDIDYLKRSRSNTKLILDESREDGYLSNFTTCLGHVKKTENMALHEYMISHNASALFANVNGNCITIVGGIKELCANGTPMPIMFYNKIMK
jgi:hypothetical protein